jgi:hypothetical protein
MQSEIHLANGEKVRVDMSPSEAQQALNRQKADASGLLQVESAVLGQVVLINPALVTHVTPQGR